VRKTIIYFCFLLLGSDIICQDALFSGTNGSLPLLNPAISNFSNYSQDFGINYRRSLQLTGTSGANQLYSVYWGGRVVFNEYDKFGFQVRVMQDKPQNGAISITDASFTGNYEKRLIDNGMSQHSLALGFTAGLNWMNVRNNQFWFGTQYDIENERIDYTLPNGEIFLNQLVSRMAFDMSLGMSWRSQFANGSELQIGGAMFHLLPYNQSLVESRESDIDRRLTLMINGKLPLSPFIDYSSTIIASFQGIFRSYTFRNTFIFDSNSREGLSFGIGIGPKWTDDRDGIHLQSLTLMTIIDLPRGQVELSYDISTGLISQYNNGRGSIELGLNYFIKPIAKEIYKRRIY
jgi:type IX secretion system PorP/SprF family membrane protein